MPMGDQAGTLVRALYEIREARRTGTLTVLAEGVTTAVIFDRGEPIDAVEDGTPGEPLGRLLVRTRVLSQGDHAKVIDAMASSLGGDGEKKFGEVATSLGLLDGEKLERALTEQVEWRIVRALQRESATWTFAEDGERVAKATRRALSLEAITLAAARWYRPEQRREIVGNDASKYVTLRDDAEEVAKRFAMTQEERAALGAFDGTTTAGDLLAIDEAAADADVAALLVALYTAGALDCSQATRPGAQPSMLPSRPSRAPSMFPRASERTTRTIARLKQLRKAALPEAPPQDRKPQNEREARVLAEQCFQHGRAHLRANRLAEAVPLLRRAFGLMPKNLEYELYAMWVEVRVHDEKPTAAQLAALRNIAVGAIRHDPNCAFAYYVLGQVTLHEGSESMAKRHFAHALRLDPDAIDAERHIRILKRREGKSRVPQVKASRPPPPAAPPPLPSAPGSGAALARVALKKATATGAQPPPLPAAKAIVEKQVETHEVEEPFALFAKVQKTLEMPAEAPVDKSPRPPDAPAKEPSRNASPPPALPQEAASSELPASSSTDRSPLPDGPSSLTAVARVADDRTSPAPQKPASPAKPKEKESKNGLYVGATLVTGVLVASFAMLGMRGKHVPHAPAPAASAVAAVSSVVAVKPAPAPPIVSASASTSASASAVPVAVPAPSATERAAGVATAPANPSSKEGTIALPAWASQRRVYVDGKLTGNGVDKLVVPCGTREIKLGSSGKPRTLEVPCGGSIDW